MNDIYSQKRNAHFRRFAWVLLFSVAATVVLVAVFDPRIARGASYPDYTAWHNASDQTFSDGDSDAIFGAGTMSSVSYWLKNNDVSSCTVDVRMAIYEDSGAGCGGFNTLYQDLGTFSAGEIRKVTFTSAHWYPPREPVMRDVCKLVPVATQSGTCSDLEIGIYQVDTYGDDGVSTSWASTAAEDMAFEMSGNASTPDTFNFELIKPEGDSAVFRSSSEVRQRIETDVLYSAYPDEELIGKWSVQVWGDVGSGAEWLDLGTTWRGSMDCEHYYCGYGVVTSAGYWALGGEGDDPPFPSGFMEYDANYRVRGTVTFDTGSYSFPAWSDWNYFSIDSMPVGFGVGTISLIEFGDRQDFLAALDSVEQPDCEVFSFSFTWNDSGTSSGDGLACVWEWLKWGVMPPQESFFNFVTAPMGVLLTRWPVGYVSGPVNTFVSTLYADSECPLPDWDASTIGYDSGSVAMPGIELCGFFAGLSDTVEGNDDFGMWLEVGIWLCALGVCAAGAKRFLLGRQAEAEAA